jgi:chorismate--pyruvate lyase
MSLKVGSLALLTEQGSLTDLMERLMGQQPELECLMQGRGYVTQSESKALGIKPRHLGHVREITMGTNNEHWLFARTVIPMSTLKGRAKRLARMNGTPLGKVLFGQIKATRVEMSLGIVFAEDLILSENMDLSGFNIPDDFPLWQRRSIFELVSGPLLISETFLPDCPVYDNQG